MMNRSFLGTARAPNAAASPLSEQKIASKDRFDAQRDVTRRREIGRSHQKIAYEKLFYFYLEHQKANHNKSKLWTD